MAVIQRDEQKVVPFGGFLIKTDVSTDDPKLQQYMSEAAQQLDKVSEILKNGSNIQIIPTKYESLSIPDEETCKKLVVGALYLYGWGGNA